MRVYKFGGASVRSAEGVRNLCDIISGGEDGILIIVSAMGKTTNAMEVVLDHFMAHDSDAAISSLRTTEEYHRDIIADLFGNDGRLKSIEAIFTELRTTLMNEKPIEQD